MMNNIANLFASPLVSGFGSLRGRFCVAVDAVLPKYWAHSKLVGELAPFFATALSGFAFLVFLDAA